MGLYEFLKRYIIHNLNEYTFFKNDDSFINSLVDISILKRRFNSLGENIIHDSSYIHESANIINSVIGKNVKIHEGVTIRDSIVLDESNIGHCSEISRSVLLKDCKITRFNYIGNSLVGENVTFVACASIATERYDKKDVIIRGDNCNWETNFYKFGSIVGNNSSIGFCTKLNPGIVIGMNTIIDSHLQINEYIPPDSLVYIKNKLDIYTIKENPFLD